MQVVAVTDPMELGFARQAMVGVRVTGAIEPVADAIAALDEVDYVVVTAGSYDVLAEVVAESDEHLLEIISDRIRSIDGRALDRDLHVPPPPQADVLVGSALSVPRSLRSGTRPPRPTGRRGRRWTVTSRPTSRSSVPATPGSGRPTTWPQADPSLRIVVVEAEVAGFGASGRNGGWCSALFPTSLGEAQDAAMRASVDEVQRVAARRGHRLPLRQGRHRRAGAQPGPAGRAGARRSHGDQVLSPRRGRRAAARDPDPRRDVHPGLRGDPPRPAGPRAGRGRDPPRRRPPRADPGALDRAGPRAHPPRLGAGAVRRARDGGFHAPAARAGAGGGAGLLADRRDRAAARGRCGTRSAWRSGRRSPTTGT